MTGRSGKTKRLARVRPWPLGFAAVAVLGLLLMLRHSVPTTQRAAPKANGRVKSAPPLQAESQGSSSSWSISPRKAAALLGDADTKRFRKRGGFFGFTLDCGSACERQPVVFHDQKIYHQAGQDGKRERTPGFNRIIPLRYGANQPDLSRVVRDGDIAVYFRADWPSRPSKRILSWRNTHVAVFGKTNPTTGTQERSGLYSVALPRSFSHPMTGHELMPFHLFRFVPPGAGADDPRTRRYGDRILRWALAGASRSEFDLDFVSPSYDSPYQLREAARAFSGKEQPHSLHCAELAFLSLNLAWTLPHLAPQVSLTELFPNARRSPVTEDDAMLPRAERPAFDALSTAEVARGFFGRVSRFAAGPNAFLSVLDMLRGLLDPKLSALEAPGSRQALRKRLTALYEGDERHWIPPYAFIDWAAKPHRTRPGLVYVGTVVHEAFLSAPSQDSSIQPMPPTKRVAEDQRISDAVINDKLGVNSGGLEALWSELRASGAINTYEAAALDQARSHWELEEDPSQKDILNRTVFGLDPVMFRRLLVQIWNDPNQIFLPSMHRREDMTLRAAVNNLRVALSGTVPQMRSAAERVPFDPQGPYQRIKEHLRCSAAEERRVLKNDCRVEMR